MRIFKTSFERESFFKSFFLFFFSLELLFSSILFLHYKNLVHSYKDKLFLEMKNYSYTFEGEKFNIELVPKKKSIQFYQLYEDDKSIYMYVPIPFAQKEVFKIDYPKEKFINEIRSYQIEVIYEFSLSTVVIIILSLIFAYISINPLRKAINLIEEVTKDIIHDLNTPVTGMLINLKILKLKSPESIRQELNRMETSINQLKLLQENLKTLIEETEKHRENVNIKEIIEEEVNVYKAIYPHVKVDLDIENIYKNVDRLSIKRILSNIIGNAFKHNLPKDGWIKIYTEENKIVVENSSKPIKNPEKVFERYYKEGQRGIGLGLSIVKKLCKEIGCRISFKSYGSKVKVEIFL